MTGGGLKSYQREHMVDPNFRIPEDLDNNVRAWARAYNMTPGEFATQILREGLRARMFPSDAIVISGPKGPISVQRLEGRSPVQDDSHHPV